MAVKKKSPASNFVRGETAMLRAEEKRSKRYPAPNLVPRKNGVSRRST
jgi:hypothetical protein